MNHLGSIARFAKRREVVFSLILFLLFWIVLLAYTGTLSSGYHLVDDHEFIRINYDLQTSSFTEVIASWVTRDLSIRFRPIYYVHRVSSVALLGTNIGLFAYQNLIFAVLCSWFLYLAMRRLKFSPLQSLGMVSLSLIGAEAAIWWRLGPNESLGMLFVSASVLSLVTQYTSAKRNRLWQGMFILFVVLASLCKESFVLLIPALLLLNLILSYKYRNKRSLPKLIKSNLIPLFILGLCFIVEMYVILRVVGADQIKYAGVNANSFDLRRILSTGVHLVIDSGTLIPVTAVLLTIILFAILIIVKRYKGSVRNFLGSTITSGTLALAVIAPQTVLYANSGIYERYLVPGTLGIALLFACYWRVSTINLKAQKLSLIFQGVWLGVLVFASINNLSYIKLLAKGFSADGYTFNAMMAELDDRTNADDLILIVADSASNIEYAFSLKSYLELSLGMKNLVFEPIVHENLTPYEINLTKQFVGLLNANILENISDKSGIQAIIIFAEAESEFPQDEDLWFAKSDFTSQTFGTYTLLVKN